MTSRRIDLLGSSFHEPSRAGLGAIVIMGVAIACGGGSSSGPDGIATDAEIVSLCEKFIGEIEASSSVEQLAGLADITQYVTDYDYDQRTTSAVPEDHTIEPSGPAHLYKMVGFLALFNGNGSAALWASLKAAAQEPANPAYLSQVGAILRNLDRCDEATTFLRKAKHHDGENEVYSLGLSSALACSGKKEEAIAQAQAAVSQAPENLVAKKALADLYFQELPSFVTALDTMRAACKVDLAAALALGDSQQALDYTVDKMNKLAPLAAELVNMYMSMPMEFMEHLMDPLDAIDAKIDTRYTQSFVDPLDRAVEECTGQFESETETALVTMGNCSTGPLPPCSCLKNFCGATRALALNTALPCSYGAIQQFLPGSIRLFNDHEMQAVGEIVAAQKKLSPATLEWVARYMATYRASQCTEMNLQVAYALTAAFTANEIADTYCAFSTTCDRAVEEAQQQAEMDSWRQSETAALQAEAAAAKTTKDVKAKGGFCLDGLGCVAVDGTKVTIKSGGILFASLSIDVASLEVGVRAGIGFGDPTGGNLFGADLTIGGTISSSGSSIDVRSSQNFGKGTGEVVLW